MRAAGAVAFIGLTALAAWLAVANRESVTLHLNAAQPGDPALSFAMPLFGVLLVGALVGLLIGGLYMSVGQRQLRRELKRERDRADRLQRIVSEDATAKRPVKTPAITRIAG